MLIFLKISEGLLDDDTEILGNENQVGTEDIIDLDKR